jgi:hypothetical protein
VLGGETPDHGQAPVERLDEIRAAPGTLTGRAGSLPPGAVQLLAVAAGLVPAWRVHNAHDSAMQA